MRKALCLFVPLTISMYVLIYLNMYSTVRIKLQKGTLIRNKIQHELAEVGRKDKYNWSYTGKLNMEYPQFAPAMNMTEHLMYINLIKTFKNACDAFNVTYLLGYGSALGAYRYHGFVPWDDDMDCRVNVSHKEILKKALSQINGHVLLSRVNNLWKFYNAEHFARSYPKYSWKWPFIDISFIKDNSTHVYDVSFKEPRHFDPRSDILPLEKGIFENMIMPVPHNIEAYLGRKYNMKDPCKSNWWDHRRGKKSMIRSSRIPCNKLFGVYPLVHRFKSGNISFEDLRLGHKILYHVEHPSMKLLKP